VTVTSASRPRLSNSRGFLSAATTDTLWVRPSAWTSLPSVAGQQRLAGLHRIDVDGNFVALTAAGAYTVDWGDGTTTNHASGATAQKTYDYTAISSTGESTLGYRQVVIQVYPQSGQTLTSVNLNVRHSSTSVGYSGGWLDVAVNGSSITSLRFSGTVTQAYLKQITVLQHSMTSTANMFQGCIALVSVPLFDTASVTNMSSMFYQCWSLSAVPFLNTSSVTTMVGMFRDCFALTSIPLLNTASVRDMTQMFWSCRSLVAVPLLNTASVTSMNTMFSGCSSLASVPLFNTASVTDMASMFSSCTSLATCPLFNTSSVTSMSTMFSGCTRLISSPAFNTPSLTSTFQMFNTCSSLVSVGLFNTASVTSMQNMFASCTLLASVPLFNLTAATNVIGMFQSSGVTSVPLFVMSAAGVNAQNMFNSCLYLTALPALNLSTVTTLTSFASSSPSLCSVGCTNINQTISFASCKLSAAQIDAIFNNLSSSGSGKTITVTGNYGAATCTTSIATAKGWTVAV